MLCSYTLGWFLSFSGRHTDVPLYLFSFRHYSTRPTKCMDTIENEINLICWSFLIGLTMGSSLASGQRRIKSQILDNVYGQGLKRISVPAGVAPFDPVIERAEEQESASTTKPVQSGSRTLPEDQLKRMSQQQQPRTKLSFVVESNKEKVVSPDETEEWAKVIEIA